MDSKIYDAIIIGGGPAGLACSIELSKKNCSCLVLEKNSKLQGKVCGDALTTYALSLLESMGINIVKMEGKKVYSKRTYKNGMCKEESFTQLFGRNYEYGVSHDTMLGCMLDFALDTGADIIYNHNCNRICRQENYYCVDGVYLSKEVVLANGVGGTSLVGGDIPNDLPVGMSARVKGKCGYSDKSFHYFRDACYEDGYAWLFPIGDQLWNIGVYGCSHKNLRQLYFDFEKTIFSNSKNYTYLRKPKGALIGATKIKETDKPTFLLAGDCAFSANYQTGEGISFAIRDGLDVANKIILRRTES